MITRWQEIPVEFFVSEVLSRYWNLEKNTLNKVIEVQYLIGLACGEYDKRIFLGEGIKPWKPYSIEPDEAREILLKNYGVEGLKQFEESTTISLLTTGLEKGREIRVASFVNEQRNPNSYKLLLLNLGYKFPEINTSCIQFWFEYDKDGNYYLDTRSPKLSKRYIRLRILDLEDFENNVMYYKNNNFTFRKSFLKDDLVFDWI